MAEQPPPEKDLVGQVAVVTGANSGIGLEACVKLAARGSTVVMCCRNLEKAAKARDEVIQRSGTPANPGQVVVVQLDLADLDSIASFRSRYDSTPELLDKPPQVDMLVLNAGIMAPKELVLTKQNLEAQMGTNVVGHYRLVYELIDLCRRSQACRIVFVSSFAHRFVSTVDLEDFGHKQRYTKWQTYYESKLGDLLLMFKINRLLAAKKLDNVVAVGCHPGYTATNLQKGTFYNTLNWLFAQQAAVGAEPTVLAATDHTVSRNAYAGPGRVLELNGPASWGCTISSSAKNVELQDALYAKCVELSGGCDLDTKL